jgi:hypothetical protein
MGDGMGAGIVVGGAAMPLVRAGCQLGPRSGVVHAPMLGAAAGWGAYT